MVEKPGAAGSTWASGGQRVRGRGWQSRRKPSQGGRECLKSPDFVLQEAGARSHCLPPASATLALDSVDSLGAPAVGISERAESVPLSQP